MKAKDLFGFQTQGINYALFRPTYPQALLQRSLSGLPRRANYMDVATGTCQLLLPISAYFSHNVIGTDISDNMIKVATDMVSKLNAQPPKTVRIVKCNCLQAPSQDEFDLITVGQALHWFDVDRFLRLTTQMLSKTGRLAVLSYYVKGITNKDHTHVSTLYDQFYEVVKPWFDFDRDELNNHYNLASKYTFSKHFQNVELKVVNSVTQLKSQNFIAYMKTYSGYNTYLQKNSSAKDPIDILIQGLEGIESVDMEVGYFGVFLEKPILSQFY